MNISQLRQQALNWWNNLNVSIKQELFNEYKIFSSAQDYTELTGREIQNIWAVQTNK